MVPCGLAGVTMTSVQQEMGKGAPTLATVANIVAASFGEVFSRAPTALEPDALTAMLGAV